MTPVGDPHTILADALTPTPRLPDQGFAARVRLAVAEEERYRAWRTAALKRLGSDALILLGLTGPAIGAARILSAGPPLSNPTAMLLVAAVVVGGWMTLSGDSRRFQAC